MIAKEQVYDYDYYMGLPEGTRVELIDGQVYDMAAAPNTIHQRVSGFLFGEIRGYLKGKSCEVFHAPFDVFLKKEKSSIKKCKTIVQPDISIICDKKKISKQGCVGAPDFIIEIVSLSTSTHDYVKKLNLYNDYGVKEYWIVNPLKQSVMVYIDNEGGFGEPSKFAFEDKIKVNIFEDLFIDFTELNFD